MQTRQKQKNKEILNYALLGIGALVAFPLIQSYIKGKQTDNYEASEVKKLDKNRKKVRIEYKDKKGKVIRTKDKIINLETIAINIYDAFYRNDMFGYSEDEEKAIAALRNVPKVQIPRLTAIYRQKYNRDLVDDFRRFLNEPDYRKVAFLFV